MFLLDILETADQWLYTNDQHGIHLVKYIESNNTYDVNTTAVATFSTLQLTFTSGKSDASIM